MFDFNQTSFFFFLAEVTDKQFKEREKKKPKDRLRVVYDVWSLTMKEKVFDATNKRKDKWAEEAVGHLSTT